MTRAGSGKVIEKLLIHIGFTAQVGWRELDWELGLLSFDCVSCELGIYRKRMTQNINTIGIGIENYNFIHISYIQVGLSFLCLSLLNRPSRHFSPLPPSPARKSLCFCLCLCLLPPPLLSCSVPLVYCSHTNVVQYF